MSIYRRLDVGQAASGCRPADILYKNMQLKNTKLTNTQSFRSAFKKPSTMKTKNRIKRGHDEVITVEGRDYLCQFQRGTNRAYNVTCAALPSVFTHATDIAGARVSARLAIEAVLYERERRYEEETTSDMLYFEL